MVFPVTLGGGKRLFADDGRKEPLSLTDARTVGAGIQLLTYERSRGLRGPLSAGCSKVCWYWVFSPLP